MASKKQVGSAAGMAAIAVVILHSFFPSGPEAGGTRGRESEKAGSGRTKTSSSTEPAPLEGPWLATRAFFTAQPSTAQTSNAQPIVYDTIKPLLRAKGLGDAPSNDWRDRLGLPPADKLRSWAIVATVADPVHSRMQLFFDSQIRSIEKAVAMHGWEFATQWLPWRDRTEDASGGIEEQRRDRQLEREQEALPGILVFRRHSDVLFVLLVPETPTKGISGGAFHAALNLATVLSSRNCANSDASCKIGLLAPSFSGSFESLTRLLQAWDGQPIVYETVFGGSISSANNAKQFEEAFIRGPVKFKFRSGIASSDSYIAAFQQVLAYYHIDPGKAAYWVEEESGFGASFQKARREDQKTRRKDQNANPEEEIPTYTFPREISHLRSAYQEATRSARSTPRSAAPTLDFSLKDPTHGEDSIPLFSDTHTPVGQSAAISTITEEFRREGTQMVFILAGNTLDSLLLARFVRTESPNTRVLIGDADMLFVPAASQESLSGTLFLSTYPMFILGQEWLTRTADGKLGEKDKHLIFPSASHQGLFNVTQLVVAKIGARQPVDGGDCLYGYRQLQIPSGSDQDEQPGLWLLSLTNYGFLPLDWFQAANAESWFEPRSSSYCDSAGADSRALEKRFPLDPPSQGWYLAVFGMSLMIVVACVWRMGTHYSFGSEWFPPMLGAALSLTSAQWILLMPAWRVLAGVDDSPDGQSPFTLAVATIALFSPLLSLGVTFYRSPGRTLLQKYRFLTEKCGRPRRAVIYSLVMLGLFLWISIEWAGANGGIGAASSQHALLFRMRSVQLFSGSSPALPLFVLSLVFFFGFVFYILRFAQSSRERAAGLPDPDLRKDLERVDEWLTAPFGLENAAFGCRTAVCLFLVAIAMLIAGKGMFGFEPVQFNCALYIAVAVVLFSLATACYDLIGIWHSLKQFLNRLEWGHKEVFDRVTKDWPRRPLIGFWKPVPEGFFASQLALAADDRSSILALHICRYVVHVIRQMQRIAWSIGSGLVMLIAVLCAYSVQAPQLVGRFVMVLFLVVGGVVVAVFASLEKNWMISRIDRTEPGDLNFEFWLQATAAVAVPLVGVLVHLFPSIGGFVSSWLAPSLEALR